MVMVGLMEVLSYHINITNEETAAVEERTQQQRLEMADGKVL